MRVFSVLIHSARTQCLAVFSATNSSLWGIAYINAVAQKIDVGLQKILL